MARTIPAADRERGAAPATYEQTGRIVSIGEDYANKDLVSVAIELPAVTRNGDQFRPTASALVPKATAAAFAIGDRVTIVTRIVPA